MLKDRFHEVSKLSKIEHCVPGQQNPEQNGKRGCAKISAHPCESAASTSDDHNFLFQTPICTFFDSTERSFSLEFNRMKCSAKTWAKHWAGSRKVEEWFVLGSGTSVFGIGLYLKCLGLRMS